MQANIFLLCTAHSNIISPYVHKGGLKPHSFSFISNTIIFITEAQECTKSCKRKKDGDYASCNKRCKRYVTCINGKKYIKNCRKGLVWNDSLKRCDCTSPTCGGEMPMVINIQMHIICTTFIIYTTLINIFIITFPKFKF